VVLADKYLGYRWAVILGALACDFGSRFDGSGNSFVLYIGIGFLIIGNGLFKP
jgi:POT family proton-dependent oligopeptide transporter